MDRALVTGVTGFIGSHLARRLVADGTDVHAIVRPGARLDRIPDLTPSITVHTDDGTTDGLQGAVGAARPDHTFHLATNFIAVHQPDDVEALVADNIGFPARLADALAVTRHRSLVNVGTVWQHAGADEYRPKNLYAATKQGFEDVLRFYTDTGQLRAVTVKLYDSYGPMDHRGKLLDALIAALRSGETLDMSSGVQLIDLVHVDDIVAALLIAADLEGGTYGVSSGRPITLRSLVEILGDVAGRPVLVRWGARADREGDMVTHWDAGPPVPGWSPRITLEQGLASLLNS